MLHAELEFRAPIFSLFIPPFQHKICALQRLPFCHLAPKFSAMSEHEASWYSKEPSGKLTCHLCPHGCTLGEGERGQCKIRLMKDGRLETVSYGRPCSLQLDPIEKKPLFHFLPGSSILSVASVGCNLHCINCQNWQISQAKPEEAAAMELFPQDLVSLAKSRQSPSIAYTYTEPLVYYEYVRDAATQARASGLRNVLVTAGYINAKPLRELCRVIDAANVDLKGFSDETYRRLNGASLTPILKGLEVMKEEGVWLELGTLVVPGYSDNPAELKAMVKWIATCLGVGTPFHLLRFHPDYRLNNIPPTPVETLLYVKELASDAGLRHVYIGDVPGLAQQDTCCPACARILIRRSAYLVTENLLRDGHCPCGAAVSGVWGQGSYS